MASGGPLILADTPTQTEIDRLLSSYEAWVTVDVPQGGDEVSTATALARRPLAVS